MGHLKHFRVVCKPQSAQFGSILESTSNGIEFNRTPQPCRHQEWSHPLERPLNNFDSWWNLLMAGGTTLGQYHNISWYSMLRNYQYHCTSLSPTSWYKRTEASRRVWSWADRRRCSAWHQCLRKQSSLSLKIWGSLGGKEGLFSGSSKT